MDTFPEVYGYIALASKAQGWSVARMNGFFDLELIAFPDDEASSTLDRFLAFLLSEGTLRFVVAIESPLHRKLICMIYQQRDHPEVRAYVRLLVLPS